VPQRQEQVSWQLSLHNTCTEILKTCAGLLTFLQTARAAWRHEIIQPASRRFAHLPPE
jgi:hypothetical protein